MTVRPVLVAEELRRRFGAADVVRGASITVAAGESIAILGPSGCGKTTLLHMLGLLDRPTDGRVLLRDIDGWTSGPSQRARLRLELVGFVFQQNNLLGHLTAQENVALPSWHRDGSKRAAFREADKWLERLGLSSQGRLKAAHLSGGEAQRVAIARALINQPAILLADEPTGSLDSQNAQLVVDALASLCREHTALIVVTHDRDVASRMHRSLSMRDGSFDA